MLGFSPSMRSEIGAAVQADDALAKFRKRKYSELPSSMIGGAIDTQAEPPVS